MTIEQLIIFILLAILAEILGTVGGFGSSLFFVPIASYFLDMHSVLGITALFHVSSNISKITLFRKGFDKKLVLFVGIPAVAFVSLGAYLSNFLESKALEISLSVFLICTSIFFLLNKHTTIKPTLLNAAGGGILSGLIAGLLGTGGAIRGITLAAFGLSIETFIATSAIIDLAIDVSRSIIYAFNGFVHQHDLYLIPILFVVSVIGTYSGKKLLTFISEEKFKSIVLTLILITGIASAFHVLME